MLERIGSSPGQWVPSTPFFGTTLTRHAPRLNMTPIAVVPDTGYVSPGLERIGSSPGHWVPSTPFFGTTLTRHAPRLTMTPIAVVPDTGYVSPRLGENNDQRVPVTPAGLKGLIGQTQDETPGQDTTTDSDGISLRSAQSSVGRRTSRQLSPPTPARSANPKVLHLFSGEDFFD